MLIERLGRDAVHSDCSRLSSSDFADCRPQYSFSDSCVFCEAVAVLLPFSYRLPSTEAVDYQFLTRKNRSSV